MRLVIVLLCVCAASGQTPLIRSVLNSTAGYNPRDPNIFPGTVIWIAGDFGTGPNTTASVSVNGTAAYVFTASRGANINIELNTAGDLIWAQLPWDTPPGPATITVQKGASRSAPFPIRVEAYAPFFVTGNQTAGFTNEPLTFAHNNASFTWVLPSAPAAPGDNLLFVADGLGPISPVIPAGTPGPISPNGSAVVSTVSQPHVTVGCNEAKVQFAGLMRGFFGLYEVDFAVPLDVAPGSQPVVIEAGGKTARSILPLKGLAVPWACYVVNGASLRFQGVASPGSIVSVHVTNVGSKEGTNLFPSLDFQAKSVTFNGVPAPLFTVSGSGEYIDALVPSEMPGTGVVTMKVANEFGAGNDFSLQMASATPGIYRLADPSNPARSNANALLAGTSWLAIPTSMAAALKLPADCSKVNQAAACGQPVKPGDLVQLFATGLGLATLGGDPNGQPLATGSVAPADSSELYNTVDAPAVTVGGVDAEVSFSGIVPGGAGRYIVQLRIPDSVVAGDDVPVVLSMPGSITDTATIAIRR